MKRRPVLFGEMLFDRFPDGQSVLGGAPFNVAWHLQAFGTDPLMISRIGADEGGRKILETMKAWGLSIEGIQIDSDHPTGVVNVTLEGTEPHYEIVEDSAYDFIDRARLPRLAADTILYHGSLACRNPVSRAALLQLKEQAVDLSFVDINLRKPHYRVPEILELIRGADWLKLNEVEFHEVFSQNPDASQALAAQMDALQLDRLVITRGEDGAEVRTRRGTRFSVKPARPDTIMDSVGAGDAFSSVLLLGQIADWSIEESLQRASEFAEAILGIRGATINRTEFYRPFINQWGLSRD